MDRAFDLSHLWNWLPAFRAVAETQHLPTASRHLHVTPSALSRTIHLLEDRLGRPLFHRDGRRLILNAEGEILLAHLRDAMRRLDDGVAAVTQKTLVGPVRMVTPAPFAAIFVLPALASLRRHHPSLQPEILVATPEDARERLLQGSLDLFITEEPIRANGLQLEWIAQIRHGIYCGPGHALYRARDISTDAFADHPFVAPPDDADDHWPAHLPRTVGLRVAYLALGIEACARGDYLAVLPDLVVEADSRSRRLRRLPIDIGAATPLHAIMRQPVGPPGRAEALLAAIRAGIHEDARPVAGARSRGATRAIGATRPRK